MAAALAAAGVPSLLLTGRARAAARNVGDAAGRHWAVIAGVNHYDNLGPQNALKYSVSDAQKVHGTFLHSNLVGFSPDTVTLLVSQDDPGHRPTKQNILSALRKTMAAAGPDDTVWFYFAGHGKDGEDGYSYVLPIDYGVGQLVATGVSTHALRDILSPPGGPKRKSVLILDSCHSGSARDLVVVKKVPNPPKTVTLAACATNQAAMEYPAPIDGGVFTHYLVQALSGDAMDANRKVTMSALRRYLPAKVQAASIDQTPVVLLPPAPADDDRSLPVVTLKAPPPAFAPIPAGLAPAQKLPLGPALVLALQETQQIEDAPPVPSRVLSGEVSKRLASENIQLFDPDVAKTLQHANPVAAASQLKRLGALFLLAGTAEVSLSKVRLTALDSMYGATATLTVTLSDDAGKVLYTDTAATDPDNAIMQNTSGAASREAVKGVTDQVMAKLLPAIKQALAPRPKTATSDAA